MEASARLPLIRQAGDPLRSELLECVLNCVECDRRDKDNAGKRTIVRLTWKPTLLAARALKGLYILQTPALMDLSDDSAQVSPGKQEAGSLLDQIPLTELRSANAYIYQPLKNTSTPR